MELLILIISAVNLMLLVAVLMQQSKILQAKIQDGGGPGGGNGCS